MISKLKIRKAQYIPNCSLSSSNKTQPLSGQAMDRSKYLSSSSSSRPTQPHNPNLPGTCSPSHTPSLISIHHSNSPQNPDPDLHSAQRSSSPQSIQTTKPRSWPLTPSSSGNNMPLCPPQKDPSK